MLRVSLRLAQLLLVALWCLLVPAGILAEEGAEETAPDNGAATSDEPFLPSDEAPQEAEQGEPADEVPADEAPAEAPVDD